MRRRASATICRNITRPRAIFANDLRLPEVLPAWMRLCTTTCSTCAIEWDISPISASQPSWSSRADSGKRKRGGQNVAVDRHRAAVVGSLGPRKTEDHPHRVTLLSRSQPPATESPGRADRSSAAEASEIPCHDVVGEQCLLHDSDSSRGPHVVLIRQEDVITGGHADRLLEPPRVAVVLGAFDETHSRVVHRSDALDGVVLRGVVDDDELILGTELGKDRGDLLGDVLGAVVGGHADAHRSQRGHGASRCHARSRGLRPSLSTNDQ